MEAPVEGMDIHQRVGKNGFSLKCGRKLKNSKIG